MRTRPNKVSCEKFVSCDFCFVLLALLVIGVMPPHKPSEIGLQGQPLTKRIVTGDFLTFPHFPAFHKRAPVRAPDLSYAVGKDAELVLLTEPHLFVLTAALTP